VSETAQIVLRRPSRSQRPNSRANPASEAAVCLAGAWACSWACLAGWLAVDRRATISVKKMQFGRERREAAETFC